MDSLTPLDREIIDAASTAIEYLAWIGLVALGVYVANLLFEKSKTTQKAASDVTRASSESKATSGFTKAGHAVGWGAVNIVFGYAIVTTMITAFNLGSFFTAIRFASNGISWLILWLSICWVVGAMLLYLFRKILNLAK